MEAVDEALVLIDRLALHVDSHYRAALLGGPQFVGWGHDQILAADTRDALFVITAGLGGEKVTKDDMYPRPEADKPEVDQPKTVADFDVAAFMRRLAGA
jgi:hypothetical protein